MKYYRYIYGRGTHNLRVLNFMVSTVWLLLIVMNLSNDLPLSLPPYLLSTFNGLPVGTFNWLPVLLIGTICITGLSFTVHGFEGGVLRFMSLGLGALSQEFIALSFSTSYPPLDVTFLQSSFLAIWFLGGCFYIRKDRQMGGTGELDGMDSTNQR